ncbi:hypothetical protein GYMLUDRAFT_59183 [Collybiopsis luxurians FD-317 M1]|uniref:Uncharacterized protein n=1 Tax=Collybiopsis luxurians FD-317 M1 TaxID=944289 RepID=A0A0D0CFB3_9AGAR|nr:hypothetical protein GYMLUDRAFT_59183 [Collybiopsis luxurians FD-317 M1]
MESTMLATVTIDQMSAFAISLPTTTIPSVSTTPVSLSGPSQEETSLRREPTLNLPRFKSAREEERFRRLKEDPNVKKFDRWSVTCKCGQKLSLDKDRTTYAYNNYKLHRNKCRLNASMGETAWKGITTVKKDKGDGGVEEELGGAQEAIDTDTDAPAMVPSSSPLRFARDEREIEAAESLVLCANCPVVFRTT